MRKVICRVEIIVEIQDREKRYSSDQAELHNSNFEAFFKGFAFVSLIEKETMD